MRLDIIYMQMHSKAYESRKAKTTNNWDGGSTVQTDQSECKELTGRVESKWSEQQMNATYKKKTFAYRFTVYTLACVMQ